LKIAVDIGHYSSEERGAEAIGSEKAMAIDVGERLIKKLGDSGYEVLLVSPERAGSTGDSLKKRVEAANSWAADLFVSIHMNAGGGSGAEVWIGSERGRYIGEKVVRSIASLGFRDRGVKVQGRDGKGLYVLRHTRMKAILVEGCFVDSVADMQLYDPERMACAILRGLAAGLNPVLSRPLLSRGSKFGNEVRYLQGLLGIKADGVFGPGTERAVTEFQKRSGIAADGIVGPQTWGRLIL
jgi:N-acetylmuramoyl-L-alanine amidase